MTQKSELEALLYAQVKNAGLPEPLLQFRPIEGRRWAVDFTWGSGLIVEVEGGLYQAASGHRSMTGVMRDIAKYNALTLAGWRVLRATAEMIYSGEALTMIKGAL